MFSPPFFTCDNKTLNEAFRIAVGDIAGNIVPYAGGILEKKSPCLMAGLDYEQPWTRDTAINIWYALAFMDADVCKNTLLAVLERRNGKTVVAGSYGQTWDNIIWAIGANEYIAASGDSDFLPFAFDVITETMAEYERSSYCEELGLFSGRAVYADGIASYPDNIAQKLDKEPLFALSTNCVYYKVYRIMADMAKKLGKTPYSYANKAEKLRVAVRSRFWNERKQSYDYFVDESDADEALGLSYAILFDIADDKQKQFIMKNTHITPNGIACEWPPFERYTSLGKGVYGRHCGTIWTLANGAWALAARNAERNDIFEKELFGIAKKAVRDLNFYEIYHPETGLPYGGMQEWEGKIVEWQSCRKQSWSATAFLAMLYRGIFGLETDGEKVRFNVCLPQGVNRAVLEGVTLGGKTFDVIAERGRTNGAAEFALSEIAKTVEL